MIYSYGAMIYTGGAIIYGATIANIKLYTPPHFQCIFP